MPDHYFEWKNLVFKNFRITIPHSLKMDINMHDEFVKSPKRRHSGESRNDANLRVQGFYEHIMFGKFQS
jgi:hypothetical protein